MGAIFLALFRLPRLQAWWLAFIVAVAMAQSQPSGKPELDLTSLEADTNRLLELIPAEVGRSGGDFERQKVQWVLALSTGHYGKDPQGAKAAREVALRLIKNLAAPGDSLTVRAWEMSLWDHLPAQARTKLIGSPDDLDADSVGPLLPTTPVQNTIGGHDTEKVIVDLAAEFPNAKDVVLLLITNTAASVAARGTALIGSDAPQYLTTLQNWRRVGGTKDGASAVVNYLVTLPSGTAAAKLEVVLVVPQQFLGASFATSRSEARSPTVATPAPTTGGGALPLFLVIVAVVAGVALYLMRNSLFGGGASLQVQVANESFDLKGISRGQTICTLVGSGFQGETSGNLVRIQNAPNVEIARLRKNNGIEVGDLEMALVAVNDESNFSRNLSPKADQEYRLKFEGEVASPSGIKRLQTVEVLVTFKGGRG